MNLFAGIRVIGSAVAAGCVLLGATAAGAVNLLYVVYEGEVTNLYDPTGVFGPGAAVGQRYRADYLFDLDLGTRNPGAAYDYVFGGAYWSTSSPALWSRLTINGVTQRLNGDELGQHFNQAGEHTRSNAETLSDDGIWTGQYNIFYGDTPLALETEFTASAPGATGFAGLYSVCEWDPSFGCAKQITSANMTTDHIAVRLGSIPEPGAWALMVLGFASVGGALRRRAVAVG